MDLRIGQGCDTHRLAEGRKLVLCGVEIPFERGLLGHSDADAALHALTDAILGALALGDIGHWFPDTDPRYAGADSAVLLQTVLADPRMAAWRIVNVDLTIVAQRPKIAPYVPAMRQRLAELLKIGIDRVSVKGKTTEKLGYVGREEGIDTFASVLLCRAAD